jgi:uncharacterized phosphosugar-binding protein
MLAQNYMQEAEKTASALLDQTDSIGKAAELVVRTVSNGKRVFVTDRYGVVEAEIADKPGNLALFRPLSKSGESLASGDTLILSSFLPDEAADMEIVTKARALGAAVITLSPAGQLSASADAAITDHGASMNAVIAMGGSDRPFGPISGILHVLLFNMLQAQTAALLVKSGKKPTVFPAPYVKGGPKKHIEAVRRFLSQGY